MPRYKKVSTLRYLCFRNIAVNMDNWWVPLCGPYLDGESITLDAVTLSTSGGPSEVTPESPGTPKDADYSKISFNTTPKTPESAEESNPRALGPFSTLTSDLVRDLMKTVREMGLMKKHYLSMFILPQLQQLDLSLYETNDPVLRLIGDRCKNLKRLYLCWNVAVGTRDLNYIVYEATKLTHLNVAGTKCDDDVVDTISRRCSELRDLDISDCNVTNRGVLYLCGGHRPNYHRLKHLQRLNLSGTKVDNRGVQLVLKKMKNIRYFEHEWLWDILYDMHTPFEPGPPLEEHEKLALQKITFFGSLYTPVVNKAVDVLCAFCPYLTEVSIFGCCFDDQAMFKLSKLTNLRSFCLHGGRNMVTFRWGLLPFLHERGATLKEISLTQMLHLNIVEVSKYCVSLEKLCFIDVTTTVVNQVESQDYLKSLKQLEIRQHMKDNFGEDVLRFILKNCHNIQQVNLFSINFINDHVLSEILEHNPLQSLEKITFDRSMGYTSDMIIRLLGHCPSLAYCHVADVFVREQLVNHVKSHNYDIFV